MPKRIFAFVLPFLLWLVLTKDFVSGAIPLNMDTNTIYAVAKYYFNNVLNGTVPLWEPFVTVGRPFYAIAICNLFNPVTLLIPVAKLLGANYSQAFIIYIVAYFWVGCLGFYLLSKRLLQDKYLAYLAYLALMFSSFGTSIFTQLTFVEILVPTIWFFYFLLSFAKEQSKGNFFGLTLSLMAVLSAYLPFYFLTVLLAVVILLAVIYPKETLNFIRQSAAFKWRHRLLTLLCAGGLLAAMGPLLAYKLLDATGDAVSPGRHCQYASIQECYERTLNQKGGMLYQEVARSGGLGERLDFGSLFVHLDKITYGSDSFFFVPVWIYLLIVIALLVRVNRLTVFLSLLMLVIGLIGAGASAPLHKFLFDHVFFFQYFRNLFFFGAFLGPLVILLGLWQLKSLLQIKPSEMALKKVILLGVVLIHGCCLLYLKQLPGVMPVIVATVIINMLLLGVYYAGGFAIEKKYWYLLFGFLMLAQPTMIINAYAQNAQEFKCPLPSAHVTPQFAWVRPDKPATSNCRIYQFVPYEDFWYTMSMTDAPASVGFPQAAARDSFDLSTRIGTPALMAYATHKVYTYEAFDKPGRPVTGPSPELDVKTFNVNEIVFKTNFKQETILVYNDSYTKSWKASIDGNPVALLKANSAFKAVKVPAGEHQVSFYYDPPGGRWVYLLTTMAMLVFLGLTGYFFYVRH